MEEYHIIFKCMMKYLNNKKNLFKNKSQNNNDLKYTCKMVSSDRASRTALMNFFQLLLIQT